MIGWVVLGSSLTLVIAFAVTTNYYRGRARKAERKTNSTFSRTKAIYKDVTNNGNHKHSSRNRQVTQKDYFVFMSFS